MLKVDVPTLFAILGTAHGLFFSIVLWLKSKNSFSNKVLALRLIATSIRVAKNIVVHTSLIDPNLHYPIPFWRTAVNFGLIHQFVIGPLFYLYFLSRANNRFQFKSTFYLHFIPYFLLLPTSTFLPWEFWDSIGLWLSYISILVYYLLAFYTYHHAFSQQKIKGKNGDERTLRWLKMLIIVVGLLLLVYSPALFKYVGYIGGCVLYAIGVYVISTIILRENKGSKYLQKKYRSSSLKEDQLDRLQNALEQLMQKEKLYLDPQLTLSKLAAQLNISSNHLSQLINTLYHKSYSDYINDLRVAEVKALLRSKESQNKTINSLAYDSGFNSISSFYTVFKKQTGMTPSEFRKKG